MKKIDISNKIVMILNYIFMLIFIMIVLKANNLQLILYLSIVPFILFLLLNNIKAKKIGTLTIILICVSIFNVVLNSFLVGFSLTFDYYKKIIMFIMSIIYFDLLSHNNMNTLFQLKHIKIINNVIILFLIVTYLLNPVGMHIYNNRVIDAACFNFTNPNLAALFILALFVIELIILRFEKKKLIRIIEIIFLIILFVFIYMTESRTALISSILFLIFFLFLHNVNIFKKSIVVFLIAISPFLFSISYMHIINNQYIVNKLERLPTLDAGLNNRVEIWKVAYRGIKKSPIIGSYNEISYGTGQSQMHNSHLDVFASYGILPFVLFIIYLFKILKYRDNQKFIYLYGFSIFIICGFLEAALFSGSAGLFIYVANLIMLTNSNN